MTNRLITLDEYEDRKTIDWAEASNSRILCNIAT